MGTDVTPFLVIHETASIRNTEISSVLMVLRGFHGGSQFAS